jgi:hypothetical protein
LGEMSSTSSRSPSALAPPTTIRSGVVSTDKLLLNVKTVV